MQIRKLLKGEKRLESTLKTRIKDSAWLNIVPKPIELRDYAFVWINSSQQKVNEENRRRSWRKSKNVVTQIAITFSFVTAAQ